MTTSPTRSDTRVLIIEDHQLFAESLDLALSAEGYDVRRIGISAEPPSPGALLTAISRERPRVVLLDLDLGRFGDGVRLVEPISRSGAEVLVVTSSIDRGRWGEAVRAGARKVLSKSQPLRDIQVTVRRVVTGLPVMDRMERERLIEAWSGQRAEHQHAQRRLDLLTVREREVLSHLMKGRTVREIADRGVVSEATVRTQVKSILAKLGVSSQLAAVGMAHEADWQAPSTS